MAPELRGLTLDRLLAQPERDTDSARFTATLQKQRSRLLARPYHTAVDPSNKAAECGLRPAVTVRKTGGCNRTDAGAQAHAILASILRTGTKRGFHPVEVLKYLLHHAETIILDVAAHPQIGALLPPAVAPP
jgi:transposase